MVRPLRAEKGAFMKKTIKKIGVWLGLMAMLLSLYSCAPTEAVTLAAPQLTADGIAVRWEAVDGAVAYEVACGYELVRLENDITEYEGREGESVRVRAVGDGTRYLDGPWSEPIDCGHVHRDENNDEYCDGCAEYLFVVIDFYAINDLHGKFCDTDSQPGVDELSSYFKNARQRDDHVILLSSGDMWQGSAESNLTGGAIITEWMNAMDFSSMTLGNHEFDWGEDAIRENLAIADFPFLAINVFDNETGKRADYCEPSVMVDLGAVQVGIIGAIGDCYSSISSDMVEGVHFKTGLALASLVRAEAERLRGAGADFIVYSLHDGNSMRGTQSVQTSALSSYYQSSLANYVDIVFEGHSHSYYVLKDDLGTYHLQGGGENYGISHAEIKLDLRGGFTVTEAETVRSTVYRALEDDAAAEAIEEKYSSIIDYAYDVIGSVDSHMDSDTLSDVMAQLYLEAALEKWGEDHGIVLAGGYIKTRSPYDLEAGEVCYADLLSLFPFNNRMVLCSVSGEKLWYQFIQNESYAVAMSDYGNSVYNNIDFSATYYVMVDSYTQLYSKNGLTAVAYLDDTTFARDLLAAAIKEGRFE